MVRFIDREYEISLLGEEWEKKGARFVVIYGRRRIGKTRLMEEFIKNKKGIYYIAEDVNKKVQITELKEKLADFFKDDLLKNLEISEWRDLFLYLEKILPKKERIYMAIDEFSYPIKNDPGLASALQKFWDSFLSKTNIFLVISGSLFGIMSEKVLASSSPLYGRRSRDLLLRALKFRHACKFLEMPFEEKVKVFMVIGGIPEYLLKVREYRNSEDFFRKEFMSRDGYFYREPHYLLSRELKEIKTYFTILNAISYGNTRASEIANYAGIKTREIYPYLETLMNFGFIEKISSIVNNKKRGIYIIRDPFFDFWFNFVFKNRENIEREQTEIDKGGLNSYFGKRFELFVRDNILPEFLKNAKIGKWWYKDKEIDLVALDERKKEIAFFECKWKELKEKEAIKILYDLKEKSKFVEWFNEERKEQYGIIARKIENKENLRKKDFLVYDLDDWK